MDFQWTCHFCNHHQIVRSDNLHHAVLPLRVGQLAIKSAAFQFTAIRCVNADCNELFLATALGTGVYNHASSAWELEDAVEDWTLRPDSSSVVQPEYIPRALREDYYEACLIRDRSPKASATLARRCLQGMIRDFCCIQKNRLVDEINELRSLVNAGNAPKGVEHEAIDAIDAIRNVGNIGAHMEKDINLIIDVDPGEAQSLIELIELLFQDWYVARHKREERLKAVLAIAAEKQAAITAGRAQLAQQGASTPPAAAPGSGTPNP